MTTIRGLWAVHLAECPTCCGVAAMDERPNLLCPEGQKIYVRAAFALAQGEEKPAERPS